jgi:hypothetical protein
MPHIAGHIAPLPASSRTGGDFNQPVQRPIGKMGGGVGDAVEGFVETIIDTFLDLPNLVVGAATDFVKGAVEMVTNAFAADGILSPKSIGNMFLLYQLAEQFGQSDQKQALANQREEFEKFMPRYVKSLITAGQMEQTALDDLDYLLDFGISIERDELGAIKSRKKVGDGRIDIENEQLYGLRNEYATDEQGNVIFDTNANGDIVPRISRTGTPGQMDIAAEKTRDLERLARGAFGAEISEIFSNVESAKAIKGWEGELSPHLDPSQKQQAASVQALLASQDPSRLSGSEITNVERGLGRMGIGVGRTAEMDKYKAALTFGDALAQKQERLGQALAQTSPTVSSFRSPVSPGIMLGQAAVPNVSLPNQTGTFGNTGSTVLSNVGATTRSFAPKKSGGQVLLDTITGEPKP